MKNKIFSTLAFLTIFVLMEVVFISPTFTYGSTDDGQFAGTNLFSVTRNRDKINSIDSLLPDWTALCDISGTRFGEFVSAGDFNGDGFADIAVADGSYNSMGAVFIYFGSPSGPPIIPNQVLHGDGFGGFSDHIEGKCDINNDGFSDLIIGDPWAGGTGKVHIHYGSPTGLSDIADLVILPVGTNIENFGYSVTSSDLNGDGYSDVIASVIGQLDTLMVAAYIYNGSASGISGNYPSSVIAFDHQVYPHNRSFGGLGDLNDDGFEDAAILHSGGWLSVYRGNDSNIFVRSSYREYSFNSGVVYASSAGDVNSDLFDDMLVRTFNEVNIYNGSSEAPGPIPDWTNPAGICYVYNPVSSAGDFDNDGFDDVVISECDFAALYLGSATGISTAQIKFMSIPSCITSGDINGDGFSDVIITEYEKVHAFYGRDLTGNLNAFLNSISPGMNANSAVRNSDIQVEFDMDMNSTTINSSNIKVYGYESGSIPVIISYNNSNRTATINPVNDFKAGEKIQVNLLSGIQTQNNTNITRFMWTFLAEAISGTGVFSKTSSVDLFYNYGAPKISNGDLDSDGDIDAVTIDYTNLEILKNNGNAEFTISQTLNSYCGDFKLGDFDGDGDIDILNNSDPLELFSNDGNGYFTYASSSPGGGYSSHMGDLDGDGDLDIVLISGVTVRWYLNDGNGSFAERLMVFQDIGGPPFIMNLTLGDLDNDGDLDITVVVIQIHSPVYEDFITFLNDGNANFISSNVLSTWFIFSVHSDLDGDGDLDLLGINDLYFNNGSGIFTYAPFFSGTVTFALPADYDGDGDIDALFPDDNSNSVKLFKNNSSGELSFFANSFSGVNPINGSSADFDGDGDIDILISNRGEYPPGSNISVLRNDYDCNNPVFSISGNSTITAGSVNNIYVTASQNGYWELLNYDSTQASIPQNSTNDSVEVTAGNVLGRFELRFFAYRDCGGDTLLSATIYVDHALPVKLAEFTSAINGRNVTLNWSTAEELNNSGFDIEKSIVKGQTSEGWSKIGFINGSGTISEPVNYSFTDKNLTTGNYKYRLKQIDFNGYFEYFELSEEVSIGIPDKFELSQNYPNPFNPVTNLEYGIAKLGFVSLKIYDVLGRELVTLVNEIKEPGYYKIQFNASDLASGVYFYRMEAGDFVAVKKFVVMK